MIKDIFLHIKNRLLSGNTGVSDVRIFNSQDDFTDESLPFANNCVFIDFGDITFDQLSHNIELVNAEVIIKLFNRDMTQNHLIDMFDVQNRIDQQLNNFAPWGGGAMHRISRVTDDNFDGGLYVLDTTYETIYKQDLTIESSRLAIGDWTQTPQSGTTTGATNWAFAVTGFSVNNPAPITINTVELFGSVIENGTSFTSSGITFDLEFPLLTHTDQFPGGVDGTKEFLATNGSDRFASCSLLTDDNLGGFSTRDNIGFNIHSFFLITSSSCVAFTKDVVTIITYRNNVIVDNFDVTLDSGLVGFNGYVLVDFDALGHSGNEIDRITFVKKMPEANAGFILQLDKLNWSYVQRSPLAFEFELSNTFLETFESDNINAATGYTSNDIAFELNNMNVINEPLLGLNSSNWFLETTGSTSIIKTQDKSLFALTSSWISVDIEEVITVNFYRDNNKLFDKRFNIVNNGYVFVDFGVDTVFIDEVRFDSNTMRLDNLTWTKARTN